METIDHAGGAQMLTVYHIDGNHLMLTHYCMAHNQPRMRPKLPTPDRKALTFSVFDATNLRNPLAGHMHRLVITFDDDRHFMQEWIWQENGKTAPQVFKFERKQ